MLYQNRLECRQLKPPNSILHLTLVGSLLSKDRRIIRITPIQPRRIIAPAPCTGGGFGVQALGHKVCLSHLKRYNYPSPNCCGIQESHLQNDSNTSANKVTILVHLRTLNLVLEFLYNCGEGRLELQVPITLNFSSSLRSLSSSLGHRILKSATVRHDPPARRVELVWRVIQHPGNHLACESTAPWARVQAEVHHRVAGLWSHRHQTANSSCCRRAAKAFASALYGSMTSTVLGVHVEETTVSSAPIVLYVGFLPDNKPQYDPIYQYMCTIVLVPSFPSIYPNMKRFKFKLRTLQSDFGTLSP